MYNAHILLAGISVTNVFDVLNIKEKSFLFNLAVPSCLNTPKTLSIVCLHTESIMLSLEQS